MGRKPKTGKVFTDWKYFNGGYIKIYKCHRCGRELTFLNSTKDHRYCLTCSDRLISDIGEKNVIGSFL
jgi:DNA-directed RNA polymerase subunit RPC12/RpoP